MKEPKVSVARIFSFQHLLTDGGWLSPGSISVDDNGWITAVTAGRSDQPHEDINGIAIPGISNVHSHAFQRAMAGLSEYKTNSAEDSFWTWRDLMYHFVETITPDDLEAIAAQLYVEMLKSGYTAVGEFQYLHHDRDGTPFANPAEMALRATAAAVDTGIGATILPVLYQHAGFGKLSPEPNQRRFINDVDKFLKIFETVGEWCGDDPNLGAGIAPHSLRAVDGDSLSNVTRSIHSSTPIHIHIAEQEKEVSDCEAWAGTRPVRWLLDNQSVDDRWSLIHATHLADDEVQGMIEADVIAGLCPTTEANLGDGLFELPVWMAAGGRFGIGSDSHISVSPVEELRWLEYGQRLRGHRRNIAGSLEMSTGTALFRAATSGGAAALARASGQLTAGKRADIAVLDIDAPIFYGQQCETFLDSWLFSGNQPVVKDVFVGGARVVHDGIHRDEDRIKLHYRKVVANLLTNR